MIKKNKIFQTKITFTSISGLSNKSLTISKFSGASFLITIDNAVLLKKFFFFKFHTK